MICSAPESGPGKKFILLAVVACLKINEDIFASLKTFILRVMPLVFRCAGQTKNAFLI